MILKPRKWDKLYKSKRDLSSVCGVKKVCMSLLAINNKLL